MNHAIAAGLLIGLTASPIWSAPATEATKASQQNVLRSNPFEDRTDFEDARRGLIESLPGGLVRSADGKVAWDLRPFQAFEAEDRPAPDTVNPGLWRHAQLNNINGLFEVVPGIYQARGFDVAVATFIRGKTGWIVVDPLSSEESARTALELLWKHEGKRPVTAVIYTHGHGDHYLGAGGVVTDEEVTRRKIPIVAPEGFLEELFSETVLTGNAMFRRFQFNAAVGSEIGPEGIVDFGQGKVPGSTGRKGMIPPNISIGSANAKQTLDGVVFVFQRTNGTESPGEMNFWIPSYQALCMSEVVNHGLHNIVTPRGALARDALGWAKYINEALDRWGDEAKVLFATHRWPVWGKDRVVGLLEDHRDLYKYLHDQTLHLANQGLTPTEIAETIRLPDALARNWSNHGYYGSIKLGSRGVHQRYLGFYDGNPANLDPLPPTELARRYVDVLGGADAILPKAQQAYDRGDYRWVVELLRQLVFADPANTAARELQAKAFEQLAYQTESALWRNIYLSAARELRTHSAGRQDASIAWRTSSSGFLHPYTTEDIFDYVAVRLDGVRAASAKLDIAFDLTDTHESVDLRVARGVLNYTFRKRRGEPDLLVRTTRPVLDSLVTRELSLEQAQSQGKVGLKGSSAAWTELLDLLDDFRADFPIVTPRP